MLQGDARQRANAASLRAARAWLLGKGLAVEFEEQRQSPSIRRGNHPRRFELRLPASGET
jgi:hypothetical protein